MYLKSLFLSLVMFMNVTTYSFASSNYVSSRDDSSDERRREAAGHGVWSILSALKAPGILAAGGAAVTAIGNSGLTPIWAAVYSLPAVGFTIGVLSADKQRLFSDISKHRRRILGTVGYWTSAAFLLAASIGIAALPGDYKYEETHYVMVLSELMRLGKSTVLSSDPFVAGAARGTLVYTTFTILLGKKLSPEWIGGYSDNDDKTRYHAE